jgi:hypothetical protein
MEFAEAIRKELVNRGFDAERRKDPPFEKGENPVVWINVGPRPDSPQGKYKLQAEREANAKKATSTSNNR